MSPKSYLINVDNLPTVIGHVPLAGADLAVFAKGKTVTDAELHRVFGWNNHNGRKIDIDRLTSLNIPEGDKFIAAISETQEPAAATPDHETIHPETPTHE